MKNKLALLLLLLPSLAGAQSVCSYMRALKSEKSSGLLSCPAAPIISAGVRINPVSVAHSYAVTCEYTTGSNQVGSDPYYSSTSDFTGTGQCGAWNDGSGKILRCDPIMSGVTEQALTMTDVHTFTHTAISQTVDFDIGTASLRCFKVSSLQRILQCGPKACDGGSGGGGGTGGSDIPPCNPPNPVDGFQPEANPFDPCMPSPIIIDTEGEGFHLTSASDGVTFDIRGNGHAIRIAWTAPGSHNAFLALDRDGTGTITSGKELFGNFTTQPKSGAPNGFLALSEFDKPENGGNGDGVIDDRDAVYAKLRLWIDENHDGIAQSSELLGLRELGVFSLALDYHESRKEDQFGNQFRFKAKVNPHGHDRRDEASEVGRNAYDVFFVSK